MRAMSDCARSAYQNAVLCSVVACVALLLATSVPSATGGGTDAAPPPMSFRELPVVTIHPGMTPETVGTAACEDCADECPIVFAFYDLGDTLYVYDSTKDNVKVIGLGPSKAPEVSVIDGPRIEFGVDRPHDGCIDEFGTILLVGDRGSTANRFRIYQKARSGSSWDTVVLDHPTFGTAKLKGLRLPSMRSIRIGREPMGRVALYHLDRSTSPAQVVAEKGNLIAESARWDLQAGVSLPRSGRLVANKGRSTIEGGSHPGELSIRGRLLGFDAAQNAYSLDYLGTNRYALSRYAPDGRLMASAPFPIRPTTVILEGKGPYIVTPSGDVLLVRMTEEGLVVTRWTSQP